MERFPLSFRFWAKFGLCNRSLFTEQYYSLIVFSFRHAALCSVTRKKQGNFTVRQEPDKDQDQQQLNLLSMSFYGSKFLSGGNVLQ